MVKISKKNLIVPELDKEEEQIVDNDADDDGVCNDSDQCVGFDDTVDTDGMVPQMDVIYLSTMVLFQ